MTARSRPTRTIWVDGIPHKATSLLTEEQAELLRAIRRTPGLNVSQLGRALVDQQQNVHNRVLILERMGLIRTQKMRGERTCFPLPVPG